MASFLAVEAPPKLTAFLAEHRVPQYESIFLEIGYDDVEDFANFDDRAVERSRSSARTSNKKV